MFAPGSPEILPVPGKELFTPGRSGFWWEVRWRLYLSSADTHEPPTCGLVSFMGLIQGVLSCPQVCPGVLRCVQMSSGVFRCVQVSSGVLRCVQVSSGVSRCVQVSSGGHVTTLAFLLFEITFHPLPALFFCPSETSQSSFIFIPPRPALNSGPKRQIHNMRSSNRTTGCVAPMVLMPPVWSDPETCSLTTPDSSAPSL